MKNACIVSVVIYLAVVMVSCRSVSADDPVAPKKTVKQVAILLFSGVELMDFAGPAEVFIVANEGRWVSVAACA